MFMSFFQFHVVSIQNMRKRMLQQVSQTFICRRAGTQMNVSCLLLQRALPVADEPDDSPISEGGDASGRTDIPSFLTTYHNAQIHRTYIEAGF